MFGREFEGKARDLLIERLRNRPYAYVAQEHVRLSQAPVWKSAASSEARVARAHDPRVRRGDAGWRARDARRPGARGQRSGGRRGVDAARRRRQGRLGARRRIRTRRRSRRFSPAKWANLQRQDYIPSRLVENLYWLGRYAVRCENTARLLLRTLAARSDARASGHTRGRSAATSARYRAEGEVFDALRTRDSQGLQADVKHLAWCASQVRNRLSARYWRGVVGLQRQMQEAMAHARQQPRSLRARAAVAGRAHRLLRRRHDARRGLARDAPRPAHRAHAVRRQHPGAPARESARHASRGRRMAARRLRQHAYLPRALRSACRGCRRC